MATEPVRSTAGAGFLVGGGEMGARMRAFDWDRTPLGRPERWPQSLKTIVRVMLDSRYAMWMLWGPELTFFCNDAYLPTVGLKRDWVLGSRSDKVWEEIWPDIGPRIRRVLDDGGSTWDEGLLLFLERNGFPEETYHTFSYSPVYDDAQRIAGMLCVVTEVTERVIGERRLEILRELATTTVLSVDATCVRCADVLARYPLDLPFAALYLVEPEAHRARLAAATRELPVEYLPPAIELDAPDTPEHVRTVLYESRAQRLAPARDLAIRVPAGPWPDLIQQALVLPVRSAGQSHVVGLFIAGLSPRRPVDDAYVDFVELVTGRIGAALADAQAYEAERRRAEALAEIDRAKTAFFSNVSHEFRTPLTLMRGPIEDLLARPRLDADVREQLELVDRNGLRLQKLVNSLLEFSRLEAGRVQATFHPLDLGALTRDLASTFRSAIERAGVELVVDCPSLDETVYVDREMWEKIVLNLLSNAFKFTFEGRIHVSLARQGREAVLRVADTGVGVPEHEIARLFERFHRVEGTHGRTHEGSGIGLALVQELVRMHRGTIGAESRVGAGTTFEVRLPLGCAHLPAERVQRDTAPGASVSGANAYVQEALRWLPEATESAGVSQDAGTLGNQRFAATFGARLVLADDNADMRAYLRGLLAPFYAVEAVADGAAALAAARRERPDLVLSDVMMPNLDGFGLVAALRGDAGLATVPVVLLSARAGEEARIEGLDRGADDYVVKPFSARELLARVGALLERQQLRASHEERLQLGLDAARMVVWDLELASRSLATSANLAAIVGTDSRERLLALDIVEPRDRAAHEAAIQRAIDTRGVLDDVIRIVRPDTLERRWLWVRGRVVANARGEAVRLAGVTLDVSALKRAEETLREADRRKDEFLATLAHELRNPLAPIRNAAKVLTLPSADAASRDWAAKVIERQVQTMALLLDDLLDVSRITRGKLVLQKQRLTLASTLEAAVEVARPLIEARQHTLVVRLPDTPIELDADPLRLSQVLANLLTNAAKYTDARGRIEVSARTEDAELVLDVQDTGIGLEPESLERVFEMFSQVKSAIDRSEGGLGIGLALVKGLVELHGGRVGVASEGLGRGSTFTVRLPIATRSEPREPAVAGSALPHAHRRVLVADDNRDAARTLGLLLELAGHDVHYAHDGVEAWAAAERLRPDLVLLDVGMPKMSGHEVARAIRATDWGASPMLVALTGWGQDEDRRRSLAAGFDHHVTKPIDPDELERLVAVRPPPAVG